VAGLFAPKRWIYSPRNRLALLSTVKLPPFTVPVRLSAPDFIQLSTIVVAGLVKSSINKSAHGADAAAISRAADAPKR